MSEASSGPIRVWRGDIWPDAAALPESEGQVMVVRVGGEELLVGIVAVEPTEVVLQPLGPLDRRARLALNLWSRFNLTDDYRAWPSWLEEADRRLAMAGDDRA